MAILGIFGKGKGREEGKNGKKSILVVDDEPSVAQALAALLSDRGYRVTTAFGGGEGIEKAKSEKPNLILLDLMMPEISGFDVCRMVKQDVHTQHIPVLVLTAMQMTSENMEKAFQSGADAYVAKPYDTPRLLEKIGKLLSGSDAGQQLRR